MPAFKVKITTKHETCNRVCQVDVIAANWLKAGRAAVKLIKPVDIHWISVLPQSAQGGAK